MYLSNDIRHDSDRRVFDQIGIDWVIQQATKGVSKKMYTASINKMISNFKSQIDVLKSFMAKNRLSSSKDEF